MSDKFRLQAMTKWDKQYAIDTLVVEKAAFRGPFTVGSVLQSAPMMFEAAGPLPLAFRLPDGQELALGEPLESALQGEGLRFVSRTALVDFGSPMSVFEASTRVDGANDGVSSH